jgi:putative ATP-binding cassette transporter
MNFKGSATGFLKSVWVLTRPYWKSEERWMARLLLTVIIGLNLGEVYISVLINKWNNDFYNALQAVDKEAFVAALIRFSYLAGIFIIIAVYKTYLNQMLRIKWRRWLTGHYLSDWLGKRNYYRMQLFGGKADNPDQRISEDIEQFIQLTLGLSLGLLSSVVTLFSFLNILWGLSGALEFDVYGRHISIEGYMVWVALVYAAIGTWITMKIGRPLILLNFNQQRFEADFRFSLVRFRENSESIAFYKGEARETENFMQRFSSVVDNFWQIMLRQKIINWFISGYGQIAIIFPFIVAAPRFFAGKIQLGGLMQTASAFGQVQGALSYIIEAYTSIATWKAVIERLNGFNNSIKHAEDSVAPAALVQNHADFIKAENLTVFLPDGSKLLENINLDIKPGNSLLITGASGAGKSTLLRVLAGLWPFVEGGLALPQSEKMLFLPQKPYLPLGTLREVLCYPLAADINDEELQEALSLCRLGHLSGKLSELDQWSHILSLGEQQRIAFARILITKPEFIFMDEATSALDETSEADLYSMLKDKLPGAAIISVGHRSTLRKWHEFEKALG